MEKEIAPIAELFPPQGEWTEEDYFSLPDTNRIVELSEGRIIMPPHPTYSHQIALLNLYKCLDRFVVENGLGEVLVAPLPVRLWPGKIREPDILFIAKEHADRIGEKVCGVPDLVVEVLSSGTEKEDRERKYLEYARAGVREYWIVDPEAQSIEVHVLRGDAYRLQGKYRPGESAPSRLLPGFEVKVAEVFRP